MSFRGKYILLGLQVFLTASLQAQYFVLEVGSPKFIKQSEKLPEGLTSERSIVILSVPNEQDTYEKRGSWEKIAEEVHKNLRRVGVDAIAYIYKDDLNAGPEVKNAYLELLDKRQIKNLIAINLRDNYEMMVTAFDSEDYIKNGQSGWKTSSPELETIMLRLGRQVLRQEMVRSNFLIPEGPEYLDDLNIFDGTRLENYPSRLKSLKLAVVSFQKVPLDKISDPELSKTLAAYNMEVEQKNKLLEQIMETYPFDYQIMSESDEDALYRGGFQYALMPLSSTGKSIKKILNYPTLKNETDYISSGYNADLKRVLTKIPVQANVTKYYIKQTIVKDIHTGNEWDADATWDSSLRNFLFNLKVAFHKIDGF